MYVVGFIESRRFRNTDPCGTPTAPYHAGKSRTFEPFSHKRELTMLGIEPNPYLLRSRRSTRSCD